MHISDNDLRAIRAWAARHPEIKKVFLYGSRARGDHRPNSDIDLAIQMEGDDPFSAWFFWHQEYKKTPDLVLEFELHLEWYEPNAGLERVGPGVERDGLLIYER